MSDSLRSHACSEAFGGKTEKAHKSEGSFGSMVGVVRTENRETWEEARQGRGHKTWTHTHRAYLLVCSLLYSKESWAVQLLGRLKPWEEQLSTIHEVDWGTEPLKHVAQWARCQLGQAWEEKEDRSCHPWATCQILTSSHKVYTLSKAVPARP